MRRRLWFAAVAALLAASCGGEQDLALVGIDVKLTDLGAVDSLVLSVKERPDIPPFAPAGPFGGGAQLGYWMHASGQVTIVGSARSNTRGELGHQEVLAVAIPGAFSGPVPMEITPITPNPSRGPSSPDASVPETIPDGGAPDVLAADMAGPEQPAGELIVTAVDPSDGQEMVSQATSVTITFSGDLAAATVSPSTVRLAQGDATVECMPSLVSARQVRLTPKNPLALGARYVLTLNQAIQDTGSPPRNLAGKKSFSFTTRDGAWAQGQKVLAAMTTIPPKIAVNGAGNAVAATFAIVPGAKQAPSPMAMRYDAKTSMWSGPSMLDSMVPALSKVDVAIDDDGRACVTWGAGWFDDRRILLAVTPGPNAAWSNRQLNVTVKEDSNSPGVTMNGKGGCVVTWQMQDITRMPAVFELKATSAIVNTVLNSTTWTLAQQPTLWASNASVAAATDEEVFVWQRSDGTRINVYSSVNLGQATLVSSGMVPATAPVLAMDRAGNAMALWQQPGDKFTDAMFSRRLHGNSWSAAKLVSDGNGNVTDLAVVADRKGSFVAVWLQPVNGAKQVFASRWSVSDGKWSMPPTNLSKSDVDAAAPRVALDAAGNGLVVWQQPTAGRNDIWAARYVAGAADWQAASRVSDALGAATAPDVGLDDLGRGFVVWSQVGAGAVVRRFE